ncbi:ABC-2 type transport system permease protein [Microvirga flocculans]|uniref:Transport permease protein n=1 Tax=Microvirga flocculans TaxID=217168 RepID=A0A7W6IFJ7_9HYPH|nr:ABC transporter permease [Microvirga flocculans]MBB4040552.1 ABC-2 type transport system permease protein [Microvirga flocculans]
MSDRPAPALAPIREAALPSPAMGYLTQVYAVAAAEIQKLGHDPSELLTRALQPAIWLLLFGQVMAQVRGIADGGRYLDFLAPGILAQSVLFAAIFYGIAVIWERDLGVLHRYMVSPAPRSALVLGKAASSAVRGLSQAVIVYGLAVLMGIEVSFSPVHIAGVALFIAIGSALFSTFSLIIACIVKTRERFMGIGQVLTMPIFFASNAIYPIELMPAWLRAVSSANPLTYEVDGLRALMLAGGTSKYGLGVDLAILTAVTALLVAIAARMYPRLTS